jgi:hypothetical protein
VRAVAQFGREALQRIYRVPSDTVIYDLKCRLRCRRCNSRRDFEVTMEELPTGR